MRICFDDYKRNHIWRINIQHSGNSGPHWAKSNTNISCKMKPSTTHTVVQQFYIDITVIKPNSACQHRNLIQPALTASLFSNSAYTALIVWTTEQKAPSSHGQILGARKHSVLSFSSSTQECKAKSWSTAWILHISQASEGTWLKVLKGWALNTSYSLLLFMNY